MSTKLHTTAGKSNRAAKTTVRIPIAGWSEEPGRRAAQIAAIALTLPDCMFGR